MHARRLIVASVALTSLACDPLDAGWTSGESSSDSTQGPSSPTSTSETGDATPQSTGAEDDPPSPVDDTTSSGTSGATSTSTGSQNSTGASTSGLSSTGSTDDTTSTTDGTTESSTTSSADGDDASFVAFVDPTEGGSDGEPIQACGLTQFGECSTVTQDCPEGEKCVAWSDDGRSAWNSTRCTPIAPSPVGPGQQCRVEGNAASGIDDCEPGSMCFFVDPRTNLGWCALQCHCSDGAPSCADGRVCVRSNANSIALCLASCDPLLQNCPSGQGCWIVGEQPPVCLPVSADGQLPPNSPCAYINDCQPGLVCAPAATQPGCPPGSGGCCSSFCDLDEPTDCRSDQQCIPIAPEADEAPLQRVGFCGT